MFQTLTELRLVDSINSEEKSSRTRVHQGSGISRRTFSIIPGRLRTISTPSAGKRGTTKNHSMPSVHPPPSSISRMIPGSSEMLKIRDVRKPPDIGIPARTRTRQHRRDSLDLDDVMNGSEYDLSQGSISTKQFLSLSPAESISHSQYHVSSHTRDLIAFLAEGPPDPKPKLSQSGSELLEFLAQGPPDYLSSPPSVDSKAKNTSRLQRMISKLSIGEKTKTGSDTSSFKQPHSPARSTFSTKTSATTPSSLSNWPIPPLPKPPPQYAFSYKEDKSIYPTSSSRNETHVKPLPLTPPAVPSDTQEKRPLPTHANSVGNAKNEQSTKEVRPVTPTAREKRPLPTHVNSVGNTKNEQSTKEVRPVTPTAVPSDTRGKRPLPTLVNTKNGQSTKEVRPKTPVAVQSDTQEKRPLPTHVNSVGNAKNEQTTKEVSSEPQQQTPPVSIVRTISRKVVPTLPAIDPPPIPFFTETDAKDMQRLLTEATTADECRLIFNMFMTRSAITTKGSSVSSETDTTTTSSSSPTKNASAPLVLSSSSSVGEALIESTLVEFFLTGTASPDSISLGHPEVVAIEEALPVAATETTQANVNPSDLLSPSSDSLSPSP